MTAYNKVILIGNLTRDPELKLLNNGDTAGKISIAINYDKKVNGERQTDTTFVDIDIYGKNAETIQKYFSKGKPILVEGRLEMQKWKTQMNENRQKLVVRMDSFKFVGTKSGEAS